MHFDPDISVTISNPAGESYFVQLIHKNWLAAECNISATDLRSTLVKLHNEISAATEDNLSPSQILKRIQNTGTQYKKQLRLDSIIDYIASLNKLSTITLRGQHEKLALEFCTLPNGKLLAEEYNVIRLANRMPRSPSKVTMKVLIASNVDISAEQWNKKYKDMECLAIEATRDHFESVSSQEQGLLLVAHGFRKKDSHQEMVIELDGKDNSRYIKVADIGQPLPKVLFLCSCYSGIEQAPLGFSLTEGRGHATVAADAGSQHVLAGLTDLLSEEARNFMYKVTVLAQHQGLPIAVINARNELIKLGEELTPEQILTLAGIGYFSDLSGVEILLE